MYKLHFFIVPLQPLNKDEYLLINILRYIMHKKTYMKPLVSVYAIETSTFLADSTTPPHVQSSGFNVDEVVKNGDNDDVWE